MVSVTVAAPTVPAPPAPLGAQADIQKSGRDLRHEAAGASMVKTVAEVVLRAGSTKRLQAAVSLILWAMESRRLWKEGARML